MTNLRGHHVHYKPLLKRGALAGALAAIVMAIVQMALAHVVDPHLDAFSFPRVVASLLLGSDAAHPVTGFAATPVLVGLGLHTTIGALFGSLFAFLIAFTGLDTRDDGLVGVMLMALVYAVILFVLAWTIVGHALSSAFDKLPEILALPSHAIYALALTLALNRWEEDADDDLSDHSPRL